MLMLNTQRLCVSHDHSSTHDLQSLWRKQTRVRKHIYLNMNAASCIIHVPEAARWTPANQRSVLGGAPLIDTCRWRGRSRAGFRRDTPNPAATADSSSPAAWTLQTNTRRMSTRAYEWGQELQKDAVTHWLTWTWAPGWVSTPSCTPSWWEIWRWCFQTCTWWRGSWESASTVPERRPSISTDTQTQAAQQSP